MNNVLVTGANGQLGSEISCCRPVALKLSTLRCVRGFLVKWGPGERRTLQPANIRRKRTTGHEKAPASGALLFMAEREGFEPSIRY